MPRKTRGWKVWVTASGEDWRCRWNGRYGTGQRTFIKKRDADELEEQKRQDFQRLDAGLPVLPKTHRPLTVGEGCAEYLTYAEKEKSFRTYRNFDKPAITSLEQFLGSGRHLVSIEPADVQKWKHSLPGTTTALMHWRQCCAFFAYMVKLKRISENPTKGLAKPREGAGGRALIDDELKRLMAAAPPPLYRTGIFSLNTLLRIDEVCRFDWSWVSELSSGAWLAHFPWQLRKTRRKLKKDAIFPINAAARAVMGERKPSGQVFPWRPNTIQQQIVAARKAAKLSDDITFHCFRHTGATRYLANGGHMEDLLENGSRIWADPRSLLRYIHVDPETLVPRFSALKYPDFGPYRAHIAPKSEEPPAAAQADGS